MIKKHQLTLSIAFSLLLLLLTACSKETSLVGKLEDSKIILDEERKIVTFHAVLHNEGAKPSTPYYAKFVIEKEQLQQAIGTDSIVFTSNGEPFPIPISSQKDFFVSETFSYDEPLTDADLEEAVSVVIFSENDEEIVKFTISNVVKEER